MRITALILTLGLATSCSRNMSAPGIPAAEAARIVTIAKHAVAANDTWADLAEYEVQRNGHGWSVTAWRIEGHDFLGRAQFVWGGFRDIEIDENGTVTNYVSGH